VAPEVALARLARRITNGNNAEWSVERVSALLEKFGLKIGSNPLVGVGTLIVSEKTNSYPQKSGVHANLAPVNQEGALL
jgi:hypothetical protein